MHAAMTLKLQKALVKARLQVASVGMPQRGDTSQQEVVEQEQPPRICPALSNLRTLHASVTSSVLVCLEAVSG